MRLLQQQGPSSSSEEADDSSAEAVLPCHCASSFRSPRVSPRPPLTRVALWCRSRRHCFCLGISLTFVALMANFVLFFVLLDLLLALLRRKCADGNGQQKAAILAEIGQTHQTIGKWQNDKSVTIQTLLNANKNNGTTNANTDLATVRSPFGLPSDAIAVPSLLPNGTPTNFSHFAPQNGTSSSFSTSPPSSSPLPPLTLISNRFRFKFNGTAAISRSSKHWPTSLSTASTTTTSPRIRVAATDRMALARQRVTGHANPLLPFQTKSDQSVTVVTALLDIGRDRWRQYGRTLDQYHQFMRNLLQLHVPMIVIVDEKSAEFVHRERARINWGQWTKVVQLSMHQLPLAIFQKRISHLMDSELANWRSEWEPSMRSHPEASQAEYVVVVNSKPYFLAQAAADNPFGTEFFVWLDAGYGHGDRSVFPPSWEWHPTFARGKVSVIKLTPPRDLLSRYSLEQLYRDVAVLSGGFLAGDRRAVTQFHREHHRMFLELLEKGRVDDDQTFLVLLVNQNPALFNIVNGDWFDAFKSF